MKHISGITSLAVVLLAVTSCIKEKLETTYNGQESKIDTYITNNMYVKTTTDGVTTTDTLRVVNNGGSNRLVTKEGTGEQLNGHGTIAFHYAGYVFSGSKSYSNLFVTNHEETAIAAGWNLKDASYSLYQIQLDEAELIEGLRKGLAGVRSGEECQILFSGKYGFGNKAFGTIPANSALLFEIWVKAVSNE